MYSELDCGFQTGERQLCVAICWFANVHKIKVNVTHPLPVINGTFRAHLLHYEWTISAIWSTNLSKTNMHGSISATHTQSQSLRRFLKPLFINDETFPTDG